MRRIALPMIGGMASTLILTLIVIPAIYYIRVGQQLRTGHGHSAQTAKHPPNTDGASRGAPG